MRQIKGQPSDAYLNVEVNVDYDFFLSRVSIYFQRIYNYKEEVRKRIENEQTFKTYPFYDDNGVCIHISSLDLRSKREEFLFYPGFWINRRRYKSILLENCCGYIPFKDM